MTVGIDDREATEHAHRTQPHTTVSKAPSKARRSEVKTSPDRSVQRPKPSLPKAVEDSTIKATFYLTKDAVNNLEDAWLHLRRTSDATERGAITKSLIVRLALEIALDDVKAKGAGSQLVKRLEKR